MIINGPFLLLSGAILNPVSEKRYFAGTSYGLSEVGYDIRVRETVTFHPPSPQWPQGYTSTVSLDGAKALRNGRTALASSIEEFNIPRHLWGELRNKSTWARNFVDAALGTDMEPGWKGFLTIEIVFNGDEPIVIPAGAGLVKAVFHEIAHPADYGDGKYQNQPPRPVPAIME